MDCWSKSLQMCFVLSLRNSRDDCSKPGVESDGRGPVLISWLARAEDRHEDISTEPQSDTEEPNERWSQVARRRSHRERRGTGRWTGLGKGGRGEGWPQERTRRKRGGRNKERVAGIVEPRKWMRRDVKSERAWSYVMVLRVL